MRIAARVAPRTPKWSNVPVPVPTLSTPGLTLTVLDETHEGLYRALYSNPRVMARIAAPLDDAALSRAFRRALLAASAQPPTERTWVATERATGRGVGIGALIARASDTEIGLMLMPFAWNARYSLELIDALIAHAFDDLGIDRLTGVCRVGPNERMSRRLLLPHGFVPASPDRPATARWVLDRSAWRRPVGIPAHSG